MVREFATLRGVAVDCLLVHTGKYSVVPLQVFRYR
jgi:hypothetical protein